MTSNYDAIFLKKPQSRLTSLSGFPDDSPPDNSPTVICPTDNSPRGRFAPCMGGQFAPIEWFEKDIFFPLINIFQVSQQNIQRELNNTSNLYTSLASSFYISRLWNSSLNDPNNGNRVSFTSAIHLFSHVTQIFRGNNYFITSSSQSSLEFWMIETQCNVEQEGTQVPVQKDCLTIHSNFTTDSVGLQRARLIEKHLMI